MNTSLPLILQDRVLVNRFPARIRNRVDFPAIHQLSCPFLTPLIDWSYRDGM